MILQMEEKFEDYLRDESKLQGYADSISFPSSEDDIRQIIEGNRESCITIQGGRTGLVGGRSLWGASDEPFQNEPYLVL